MILIEQNCYKLFTLIYTASIILLIIAFKNSSYATSEVSFDTQKNTSNKIIQQNAINENIDKIEIKEYSETNSAKVIILNKITAKPITEILKINENKIFGNISLVVKKCCKNIDPYKSNNVILVSINDARFENENLFQGWLFSDNSSISTFEHPVYEIIPIECINQ